VRVTSTLLRLSHVSATCGGPIACAWGAGQLLNSALRLPLYRYVDYQWMITPTARVGYARRSHCLRMGGVPILYPQWLCGCCRTSMDLLSCSVSMDYYAYRACWLRTEVPLLAHGGRANTQPTVVMWVLPKRHGGYRCIITPTARVGYVRRSHCLRMGGGPSNHLGLVITATPPWGSAGVYHAYRACWLRVEVPLLAHGGRANSFLPMVLRPLFFSFCAQLSVCE
jgi:hypothetical protein